MIGRIGGGTLPVVGTLAASTAASIRATLNPCVAKVVRLWSLAAPPARTFRVGALISLNPVSWTLALAGVKPHSWLNNHVSHLSAHQSARPCMASSRTENGIRCSVILPAL